MVVRTVVFFGLALAAGACGAAGLSSPDKLPIEIPKKAQVLFETEASGADTYKAVKFALSGNMPGAPKIHADAEEIKPLLEHVHALHVVIYSPIPGDDPIARFEKQFSRDGLSKVASQSGPQGILIMRHSDKTDHYGVVILHKDSVVVVRTDGAPGLGDISKFVGEALSRAFKDATNGNYDQ